MEDFVLKVGDLVKLRDDLEDGKYYGVYYHNSMKFNGFKIINKIFTSGELKIRKDDENYCYYTKEMIAEVKRLTKYETIYKREEPILNDKEKEYLGNVIRPFRNRVICVVKTNLFRGECISIKVYNDFADINFFEFPYFKNGVMYKNMKVDKSYTLEELGL